MQTEIVTAPRAPSPTLIEPLTWSLDDVAVALGIAGGAFRARRAELEANGFPRPLPGLARPRWSIEAVRAWVALSGTEG